MKRAVTPRKCLEIWLLYSAFRRTQIAPSTYKRDYVKFQRRLERMKREAPHLKTSIEIRDWLLQAYSAETARRTIVQLKASCQWAMESSLLKENPFLGLQRHIKPARPARDSYANFTTEERDRVIARFDQAAPFYSSWVRFLFWTGCRPEEARALRWSEHIATDHSAIQFVDAFPYDMPAPQRTKSYKETRFPCNDRLRRLLAEQRLLTGDNRGTTGDDWVFQGREGGPFEYHNFQSRHWRPLLLQMKAEGQVSFYLSQYHCRHTAITLMLAAGMEVQDVSYLCRVETDTLFKHYVGRARRIVVPEF